MNNIRWVHWKYVICLPVLLLLFSNWSLWNKNRWGHSHHGQSIHMDYTGVLCVFFSSCNAFVFIGDDCWLFCVCKTSTLFFFFVVVLFCLVQSMIQKYNTHTHTHLHPLHKLDRTQHVPVWLTVINAVQQTFWTCPFYPWNHQRTKYIYCIDREKKL